MLYVGAFSRRKGILTLFEALRELLLDDRHYRLTLIGAPEMLGSDTYTLEFLRAQCEALGVADRVQIMDYIDEMPALQRAYASADIFLLASRREGFPRVVEEALLNGVAVVAFGLPCLEAVLQSDVHALLVPVGNLQLFVRAVRRLVGDSGLRARLTNNGRQLMRARFPLSASEQHTRVLCGK
jgi:glycosyltransferase involved in cell wall biosynthesis